MRGRAAPESVNPAPETPAALIVTAALPAEESVRVCDEGVLTGTLPKDRLDALTVSMGVTALSCRE